MACLIACLTHLHADETWDFTLTPYLWFAGIEGNVSTVPGFPVAPLKVSPREALEDTEASFMVAFAANRGQHGISGDFFYSKAVSDEELVPAFDLLLKSTSKSTVGSLYYHYTLAESGIQLFAGFRYWKVDTQLDFSGGLGFLNGRRIRHDEDWTDPVIGLRGRYGFGDSPFYGSWILATGGVLFGSDHFYDVVGTIGYQWTPTIATGIGYRLYDLKYEEGEFYYDVRQEGWLLSLRWDF